MSIILDSIAWNTQDWLQNLKKSSLFSCLLQTSLQRAVPNQISNVKCAISNTNRHSQIQIHTLKYKYKMQNTDKSAALSLQTHYTKSQIQNKKYQVTFTHPQIQMQKNTKRRIITKLEKRADRSAAGATLSWRPVEEEEVGKGLHKGEGKFIEKKGTGNWKHIEKGVREE